MQRRVALWILGAFQTLPSFDIKTIASLIPIYLYLQKLKGRSQLRAHALPPNHILQSLLESRLTIYKTHHHLSLDLLTKHQGEMIKGPIIDMNNRFNKVFPSFDSLNSEFSPGNRIINTLSSCFSFHPFSKQSKDSLLSCSHQLDNLAIVSSKNPLYALVVTNASIRNNVITSIAHIHICDKPIVKTLHYIVNITSMEAKLFVMKYGINQAINSQGTLKIIVVTDSIHSAKRIFNFLSHPFQVHIASILSKLRKFFTFNLNNKIEFWKCPSWYIWSLHKVVDKKTKLFNPIPHYLCKISWDFSKKRECDNIAATWKIIFQASDLKGWQFLKLYDDDNNPIELHMLKKAYSSNTLVIRTCFVQEWQEQSWTMPL